MLIGQTSIIHQEKNAATKEHNFQLLEKFQVIHVNLRGLTLLTGRIGGIADTITFALLSFMHANYLLLVIVCISIMLSCCNDSRGFWGQAQPGGEL